MDQQPEFKPYGKTPRWGKELYVTISEKIDGTNALVHITEDGRLFAGSRNRWIQPGKKTDNFGFAQWCEDNREELVKLGPGYHYGEWWGYGIGRGYGRKQPVSTHEWDAFAQDPGRTFSLFNTFRWGAHNPNTPKCCSVVPVLYKGGFTGAEPAGALEMLKLTGSKAQPGYMNVEGVIVFLGATNQVFKLLAEHHDKHKFELVGSP